jgi:hypothetical protein
MVGPIGMPCCPYLYCRRLDCYIFSDSDFRAPNVLQPAGEWLVVTYMKTSLTIFYRRQAACPSDKILQVRRQHVLRKAIVSALPTLYHVTRTFIICNVSSAQLRNNFACLKRGLSFRPCPRSAALKE